MDSLAAAEPFARSSARQLMDALVAVLDAAAERGVPDEEAPTADPQACDETVANAQFIRTLDETAAWLRWEPRGTDLAPEQEWMATGRPPWLPPRVWEPLPQEFGSGPFFTCTAQGDVPGMWRVFLERRDPDPLWPRPWQVYRLTPQTDARIYRIDSACDWTRLLARHPDRSRGLVRLDWQSVAEEVDGVRVTPAAVCAIDGLRLRTEAGLSAPVYWTVESTAWLRWCFASVRCMTTAERR
jgi:hypothetical protein